MDQEATISVINELKTKLDAKTKQCEDQSAAFKSYVQINERREAEIKNLEDANKKLLDILHRLSKNTNLGGYDD